MSSLSVTRKRPQEKPALEMSTKDVWEERSRNNKITESKNGMYKPGEMNMLDIILTDTSQSQRINNVWPYLNTVLKGSRLIEDRTLVAGSCGKTRS